MQATYSRPGARPSSFLSASSVLLAIVVNGCTGDGVTGSSPARFSEAASLSAAAPGFAFLPPLGSASATGGLFDANIGSLNPRVTICDLAGGSDAECGGSPAAAFTTTSSPALTLEDGHYQVQWDTKGGGAQAGRTYRVHVTAGAAATRRVLGFTDVYIVPQGKPVAQPAGVTSVHGAKVNIKFRIERMAGGLSVGLAPTSVSPGGSSVATATVVDLHGAPLAGVAVSWTASGTASTLSAAAGTTDGNGAATTTVTAGAGAGTAGIQAAAGGFTASANLTIAAAPPPPPPTVTINQAGGQADPTLNQPILFTVVFSAPVTGFTNSDVSTSGSTAPGISISISGSGPTYTLSVTSSGDGVVRLSIPAGAAVNAGGAASLASTSTDNSVTRDTLPPTVTINQAAGQSDPTTGSVVNFTVTFSEPVTGFSSADISTTGTLATVGASIITGGPSVYNVAIATSGSGTVVAHVLPGTVTDMVGLTNSASTSADNAVSVDLSRFVTVITSFILNSVDNVTASFVAGGADVSFECRLDGGAWLPCASPKSYAGVSAGVVHVFEVRATDGSTAGGAVTHVWQVPPPNVSAGAPYVLGLLDHTLILNTISLTAVLPPAGAPTPATSRIAYARPGSPVTLSVDGSYDFTGSYCPGCVTQFIVGIDGVSMTPAGPNLCLGSGAGFVSVNGSHSFNAPTTPGVYILNPTATWMYECGHPVPISRNFDSKSVAILVVQP